MANKVTDLCQEGSINNHPIIEHIENEEIISYI